MRTGGSLRRREFLSLAIAFVAAKQLAAASTLPVIDAHIHLFDTRRPNGVPWPEKTDSILYRPALPDRYRRIASPLGVVGAIVIEASPWFEDNQWVLDLAAANPIIVGTVGNLEPGKPGFGKKLEKLHRNPLFRGIRYGDLWDRNFGKEIRDPQFLSDIKLLASAGLELDIYSPGPEIFARAIYLADKVPNLRIVVNHIGEIDSLTGHADLKEVHSRPQIYAKVSAVLRRVNGNVPLDLNFYRSKLDGIWAALGEDRLIYGSDWPNSDLTAPYAQGFHLVQQYFESKGKAAAEKFFWKNSAAAYRWKRREQGQPDPARA